MANLRAIRRRIKGVQSISKITKAMEMIAALRMKQAQERGLAGRPYSEKITQVIADLAALAHPDSPLHPLLVRRPVQRIGIVHITPDRGLCGGLVGNMNRQTSSFILQKKLPTEVVTVGRKGNDFMRRYGQKITAEFSDLGDAPGLLEILPIARIIIDDYTAGTIDAAYIAYTRFVTTLTQKQVIQQVLPVMPAELPAIENVDYLYEPDTATVLGGLLPRFVEMQVYHAILESIASEQSARMVAMRGATDNATELISDLTLAYNKARQESITTELLDITAGAAALA
jgi:F-type H+-transporting ATPase subunit gamma